MKKLIIFLMTVVLFNIAGAKGSKTMSFYDQLNPAQRKAFAGDWLDTAKAYMEVKDNKNAKACLQYAHYLYPMGETAKEARKVLQDSYKIKLAYDADKQFKEYIKRAEKLTGSQKVNNYLMALEIKQTAQVLRDTAEAYRAAGDTESADKYVQMAEASESSETKIPENGK